jgi:hypothetical protein
MRKRDDTCRRQAYFKQIQIDRPFFSQLCILYYFTVLPSGLLSDTLTAIVENGSVRGQSNMPGTRQARQIHTYSVMNSSSALTIIELTTKSG